MPITEIERERRRVYQKQYYRKNITYHKIYWLKKKLVNGINEEIKNVIDMREYAKIKKNQIKQFQKLGNYYNSGFKKINQNVLVYFD